MDIRFDGKVVIVTGASSGIGRSTAIEFAKSGADVVVHYNESKEQAEAVVESIQALGAKGISIQADVTNKSEVHNFVKKVVDQFGKIDILVNNAGSLVQRKGIEEMDRSLWDRVIEVNLTSIMLVCQEVIPLMKKQKAGKIINLTSVAGRTGGSLGISPYASAKAGVMALTKNMARELSPFNIYVNAVSPGIIDTRFHERYTPRADFDKASLNTLIKRPGTADECAWPIIFLASDYASYIVGETIEINGGLLMD